MCPFVKRKVTAFRPRSSTSEVTIWGWIKPDLGPRWWAFLQCHWCESLGFFLPTFLTNLYSEDCGVQWCCFPSALFFTKVWTFGYCMCCDSICRSTQSRSIEMGFNQGNASESIRNILLESKRKRVCNRCFRSWINDALACNDHVIESTEVQSHLRARKTSLCWS